MKKPTTKKRNIASVRAEIKDIKKQLKSPKENLFISRYILKQDELDALMHLAWLEGYFQAMRDERGLE